MGFGACNSLSLLVVDIFVLKADLAQQLRVDIFFWYVDLVKE